MVIRSDGKFSGELLGKYLRDRCAFTRTRLAVTPPGSKLHRSLSHHVEVMEMVLAQCSDTMRKQDALRMLGSFLGDKDKGGIAADLRSAVNRGLRVSPIRDDFTIEEMEAKLPELEALNAEKGEQVRKCIIACRASGLKIMSLRAALGSLV